jgi:hypothetical protein
MRGTRDAWRERVAQWRSSGLTAREFAARRAINASTLAHWAWRLRRESPGDAAAEASVPPMIEVLARPVTDERFEIELGGRCVRVPPSFDAAALRRLIAVLEERS